MYNARIEVGLPYDAKHMVTDLCLRPAIVTITVDVMSSSPRVVDMHDPKQCTAESLDNLMRQIVHTLQFWGAT